MDWLNLFVRQYPAEFSTLLLIFYAVIDQIQKYYINKAIDENENRSKEVQDVLFKKLDKILEEVNKISCSVAGLTAINNQNRGD